MIEEDQTKSEYNERLLESKVFPSLDQYSTSINNTINTMTPQRSVICPPIKNNQCLTMDLLTTSSSASVCTTCPISTMTTTKTAAISTIPAAHSRIKNVLEHYHAAATLSLNGPDWFLPNNNNVVDTSISMASSSSPSSSTLLINNQKNNPKVNGTASALTLEHHKTTSSKFVIDNCTAFSVDNNKKVATKTSTSSLDLRTNTRQNQSNNQNISKSVTSGCTKDKDCFVDPLLVPPPFPIQQPPLLTPADQSPKQSERSETCLEGESIACFTIGGEKRLCVPQIFNIVLRDFTLQQINQVIEELQINCSTCTRDQMEVLKLAGDIPPMAPSCGLITKTDAHRLCSTLLGSNSSASHGSIMKPPSIDQLNTPYILIYHECFGRCVGRYAPALYTHPSAKCIQCNECLSSFTPYGFVCHSHRPRENRTVHWGFDPNNWRSYLLPIEDLITYDTYLVSNNLHLLADEKNLSQLMILINNNTKSSDFPCCAGGRKALKQQVSNSLRKNIENIRLIVKDMKRRFSKLTNVSSGKKSSNSSGSNCNKRRDSFELPNNTPNNDYLVEDKIDANATTSLTPIPPAHSRIKNVLKHYQATATLSLNGPDWFLPILNKDSLISSTFKSHNQKSNHNEDIVSSSALELAKLSGGILTAFTLNEKNNSMSTKLANYSSLDLRKNSMHARSNGLNSSKSNFSVKDFVDPLLAPPPFPIQQPPLLTPADQSPKQSDLSETCLEGESIACFTIGGEKRLCVPQIFNIVLRDFTLQQINQVIEELQINCSTCTRDQMEVLKLAGDIPPMAPSCGLITKTDAHRLCSTLLGSNSSASHGSIMKPPSIDQLNTPYILIYHECFGRCVGRYAPALYTHPSAKCIQCNECLSSFTPYGFVCHSHRPRENRTVHWGFDPNNWRSYLLLIEDLTYDSCLLSNNLHLFADEKNLSQLKILVNNNNIKSSIPYCAGGRKTLKCSTSVSDTLSKNIENIRLIVKDMKKRFSKLTNSSSINKSSNLGSLNCNKRKDSFELPVASKSLSPDLESVISNVKRIKAEPLDLDYQKNEPLDLHFANDATSNSLMSSLVYPFLQSYLTYGMILGSGQKRTADLNVNVNANTNTATLPSNKVEQTG